VRLLVRLTGRLADGWAAPIPSYLPYEAWADAQRAIDQGARAADRDPRRITRIPQLGVAADHDLPTHLRVRNVRP
jgi:hypothetical protein